jgi:NitT/TauT family transport system substrate-binding protein
MIWKAQVKAGRSEMLNVLLMLTTLILCWPVVVLGQTRFLHSHSGTSSTQLAIWAAKDLGLFEKYGLDLDLVFIPGGARTMQALLSGSIQSADSDGVGPVNAILRGGDAVIVAGLINRSLFKFVAQKEITNPAQLRKKRIGVANFGGSNEFAVLLALKEWNISRDAVTLVAAGGSAVRLAAMENHGLDATVLPYDHALLASRAGMKILADIPDLVPAFPDKVITVRRSFLEKERVAIKRYLQALSEAIYQVATNREKATEILRKRLKLSDPKLAEENYNIYGGNYSYPPRVGKSGLVGVLEQIQAQSSGSKSDFELKRFLDESIVDELEREAFFKKLPPKDSRK